MKIGSIRAFDYMSVASFFLANDFIFMFNSIMHLKFIF